MADQPQALIDDVVRYLRLEQAVKDGRIMMGASVRAEPVDPTVMKVKRKKKPQL